MGAAAIVFIILFGVSIGSFLNVLIWRIPKGLNIIKPGSFCPHCSRDLTWKDNIPVISYILLRGKCRYCQNNIHLFYPVTEILTAVLFVVMYLKFGMSILFLKYIIFMSLLVVISLTDIVTLMDDFETGMIPVVYSIVGIFLGLVFGLIENKFIYYLSGISAGYLILFFPAYIYSKFRKKEGMGEGDFILFALIGSFTGVGSIPSILTLASFFGLVAGVAAIMVTKRKDFPIPFAPMLSSAAIIYVLFEDVLNYYQWGNLLIK